MRCRRCGGAWQSCQGARVIVVAALGEEGRMPFGGVTKAEVHWVMDADALVDEKGLPKDAMRVSAYWKRGVADHHEGLG
jgi:hypothetical protein